MRSKRFVIVSAVFFAIALVSLGEGWRGTANVSAGDTLASNSVKFCGSATGISAIAGVLGILLGVVCLAAALIMVLLDGTSK